MPVMGDWKKPFADALKAVQGSISETLKLGTLQIFHFVRNDSIIYGASKLYDKKSGSGKWAFYLEKDEMNRYMRRSSKNAKPRKVFHQTKYVSRHGDLVKAFTPAGGWSGDTLRTRGECEARVEVNESRACAILRFTGKAEGTLRGGDSKLSRDKVEVTDVAGSVIATQTARGRRRPVENAVAKLSRFIMKILGTQLDKKARSIS